MLICEVNLLVFSFTGHVSHKPEAARWLNQALTGPETLGLTWPVIWGFIRIVSTRSLWRTAPPPMDDILAVVNTWLQHPNVAIVNPGHRHIEILQVLLQQTGIVGSGTADAVLAAIALEHDATVASADTDFRKFPGLRWINPL